MQISLEDNLICCGDCYDVFRDGFESNIIDIIYADIPVKRKKGIEYDVAALEDAMLNLVEGNGKTSSGA